MINHIHNASTVALNNNVGTGIKYLTRRACKRVVLPAEDCTNKKLVDTMDTLILVAGRWACNPGG